MPRRRAAHTQADLERMLRAAIAVTGRQHVIRARPDGSCEIVPYEPPPVFSGDLWRPPMAAALADSEEIIL
jgi:hypothetical protein